MRLKWINVLPILFVVVAIAWHFRKDDLPALISAQDSPQSETWQLVPGSIYDGDTLRVQRGPEEVKVRLCGIDAPEKNQPQGIASRDYLRSLVARGDGSIIVVPIERDRYGRQVAELFVKPLDSPPEQELFLNGEMVQAGMAYHYARYSDTCENRDAIAQAEEMAQANRAGVWSDDKAVKPWDWRKQQ